MDKYAKKHLELKGKIKIESKAAIKNKEDLSYFYTPGVASACLEIKKKPSLADEMTIKGNFVAIVSDGTRVLGLGDIGPYAAMPVMEGKAMILKEFANVNAMPICLNTKDKEEIIKTILYLEPNFSLINLEDIETPKVFEIYDELQKKSKIAVFHDDQFGTGIVVLSAMINSIKVAGISKKSKIAVIGVGSAGTGIIKMLNAYGFENIYAFDSKSALNYKRDLNKHKKSLLKYLKTDYHGNIRDFKEAEVIISASMPGAIPKETIKNMKGKKIVFALSNPIPEISLKEAEELGVYIYGSGRSDIKNQINNSLCFPGLIKATLKYKIKKLEMKHYIAAAKGIAKSINADKDKILPDMFNKDIIKNIDEEIKNVL